MQLKQLASSLPADPQSLHSNVRNNALCMVTECTTAIGSVLVSSIALSLEPLTSNDLKSADIPDLLTQLQLFVKGADFKQGMPGEILAGSEASKILQYWSFKEKMFLVYLADVVTAVKLYKLLSSSDDDVSTRKLEQLNAKLSFLEFAEAANDTSKCINENIRGAFSGVLCFGCNK